MARFIILEAYKQKPEWLSTSRASPSFRNMFDGQTWYPPHGYRVTSCTYTLCMNKPGLPSIPLSRRMTLVCIYRNMADRPWTAFNSSCQCDHELALDFRSWLQQGSRVGVPLVPWLRNLFTWLPLLMIKGTSAHIDTVQHEGWIDTKSSTSMDARPHFGGRGGFAGAGPINSLPYHHPMQAHDVQVCYLR